MHIYGQSKTIRIMMATVRRVTSISGLRKYQAAWFLLNRVNKHLFRFDPNGSGPYMVCGVGLWEELCLAVGVYQF